VVGHATILLSLFASTLNAVDCRATGLHSFTSKLQSLAGKRTRKPIIWKFEEKRSWWSMLAERQTSHLPPNKPNKLKVCLVCCSCLCIHLVCFFIVTS